jgi:hypothetical protein
MLRTKNAYFSQKRRAEAAGQRLDFDLEQYRNFARAEIGQPCLYCFQELTIKNHSPDHATPINRGGSFSLDNIVICCDPCNRAKGILTAEEFQFLLALLRTWPESVRTNTLARLRAGAALAKACLKRETRHDGGWGPCDPEDRPPIRDA